jgi:hypothetical protein
MSVQIEHPRQLPSKRDRLAGSTQDLSYFQLSLNRS